MRCSCLPIRISPSALRAVLPAPSQTSYTSSNSNAATRPYYSTSMSPVERTPLLTDTDKAPSALDTSTESSDHLCAAANHALCPVGSHLP